MKREVPEPWATAMIEAGHVDPRYKTDVASMRQLADAAGTTTSTISAMVTGSRDTDGEILNRVAAALMVDPKVVFGWAGRARSQGRPFEPHRDADLLTAEEQDAVNELIRLLALAKRKAGEHGGNTAATSNVTAIAARRNPKRKPKGPGEQAPD